MTLSMGSDRSGVIIAELTWERELMLGRDTVGLQTAFAVKGQIISIVGILGCM